MKNFLKPNWEKIFLSIVLLIGSHFFILSIFYGCLSRICKDQFCMVDLLHSFLWVTCIIYFVVRLIIVYIFSCLVFWIYQKNKQPKT